jgi:hypothetical protein
MSRACSCISRKLATTPRGTRGLHLRHGIESGMQPLPLYCALQFSQFLKRFRQMDPSFHSRLLISSLFVLYLLHPSNATCKHLRMPRTRLRVPGARGRRPGREHEASARDASGQSLRPRWRPAPYIGELAAGKIELVAVCRRCKHRRVLFTANLSARYGEGFPAIKLRDRVRCSNCRGRSANLHESSR